MITGTILVPEHGDTGVAGASGGDGGVSDYWADNSTTTYDYSATGKGKNGGNVGASTGGTGANGAVGTYVRRYNSSLYRHFPLAGGGGGGGAADGANGSNGTAQGYFPQKTIDDDEYHMTGRRYRYWEIVDGQRVYHNTYYSANGGDGADAVTIPIQSDLQGGTGGAGGGGGGGCGQLIGNEIFLSSGATSNNYGGLGIGGKGGNGATGGQGSDGWLIVYTKA